MSTIRLTITPEIQYILDFLKIKYPPLDEPELLKVALSELYAKYAYADRQTKPAEKVDLDTLVPEGRAYFSQWLKKKGIDISELSEEEAYELIKHA